MKIVIMGCGRVGAQLAGLLDTDGHEITILDIDADNVDMLRRLGIKVFYGDASRYDLLYAAGAEKAKLIVLAIDDTDKTIEIVHTIRKHFPQLTIFARANGRADAYELLELGVKHVYRETFDTSLRAGIDVLHNLGHRSYQAHRSSHLFRKKDEADLRDLAAMRHDRKTYISTARQRIKDLEQILLAEIDRTGDHQDEGWDTASLIDEFGKNDPENIK